MSKMYPGGSKNFDESTGKYRGPKPPPVKQRKLITPQPIAIDDQIIRKMPITEKQLGQIKRMYKLK